MSTSSSGSDAFSFDFLTRPSGLKSDERLTTTVTIRQVTVSKRTVFIEVKSPAINGHPLTMSGEVSVEREGGQFKVSSFVQGSSATKVVGFHLPYLGAVNARAIDLVHKVHVTLERAYCTFSDVLTGFQVAVCEESDLRYPELKAIIAGMMYKVTLGELLNDDLFAEQMRNGLEFEVAYGETSPVDDVLTQIAQQRGIIGSDQRALDHFDLIKADLTA